MQAQECDEICIWSDEGRGTFEPKEEEHASIKVFYDDISFARLSSSMLHWYAVLE